MKSVELIFGFAGEAETYGTSANFAAPFANS